MTIVAASSSVTMQSIPALRPARESPAQPAHRCSPSTANRARRSPRTPAGLALNAAEDRSGVSIDSRLTVIPRPLWISFELWSVASFTTGIGPRVRGCGYRSSCGPWRALRQGFGALAGVLWIPQQAGGWAGVGCVRGGRGSASMAEISVFMYVVGDREAAVRALRAAGFRSSSRPHFELGDEAAIRAIGNTEVPSPTAKQRRMIVDRVHDTLHGAQVAFRHAAVLGPTDRMS